VDGRSVISANLDYLLVPMSLADGTLRGVQAISPDGLVKVFMRGAQKKGTMCVLGADCFESIDCSKGVAFAEGVATGASFRAGCGLPTVVCFDAGNLVTVVEKNAGALPSKSTVVIAADNDQFHVERAVGFLAGKLGVSPFGRDDNFVQVASGSRCDSVRSVRLGDVLADGDWHQCAKGAYRVLLGKNSEVGTVESVTVSVVPVGGRCSTSSFSNRGVEAGRDALAAATALGQSGVLAIPEFESLVGRPTDWNDLHRRAGLGGLLKAGVAMGLPGFEAVSKDRGRELERARGRELGISRGLGLSR
jgi:putative DNA primase/helicase